MQILLIVAAMLVATIMIPFTGSGFDSQRSNLDVQAQIANDQLGSFATAAWASAHAGKTGPLDRNDMILPSGFNDDPANQFTAREDSGLVYIWADNANAQFRPGAVLVGSDYTVDVGVTHGDHIDFRSGASAPLPSWLPQSSNLIIVRIRA